jgi:hypothetical protein
MRLIRRAAGAVGFVVVLGGVPGAVLAVSAQASTRPVVYNYAEGWRHGRVKPHAIYIGANAPYVNRLSWTHWTSTAYGRGKLHKQSAHCLVNNPSYLCPFHRYAVGVTLRRAETHNGIRYFSRMHWSYHKRDGTHVINYFRFVQGCEGGPAPAWCQG